MKSFTAATLPVLVFIIFIRCGYAQPATQNTVAQITVSIILKFSGKNGIPEQMELFSQNTFKEMTSDSLHRKLNWTEPYRFKFFNGAGELLYSEDIQNPLKEVIYKYSMEGIIERKELVSETGYLNFRFQINENVKKINAVCNRINGEKEIAVSSLKIVIE